MKTRFFSIAVVLLFAVSTIAKAENSRTEDSIVASSHESNNGIEMISANSEFGTNLLDEWISTRENWEQESQEIESNSVVEATQLLEEWFTGRENWEQGSQEFESNSGVETSQLLEEWFSGRENWEQGSQEIENNGAAITSQMLEEWIATRDNWEQR